MKAFWQAQALRIDGLTLRERAILFVSAAVALAALADTLWLSPLMTRQKALKAQMQQQSRELQTLRQRVTASTELAPADSPQGRLQAAVTQARSRRDALDADIASQFANAEQSTRLPALLASVLRRHERLTLVRLATAPAPAAPSTDTAATPALQGVDLSLAGAYPDLVHYLAEIERTLPGLRWGELRIHGA
ncbi:MAG: hypothetical protein Q8L92_00095, partial [Rubrivivax sp.]|nr:hypothetical protein [Rubrivivax sp.]